MKFKKFLSALFGAGSIFNINGNYNTNNIYTPYKSDSEALASDWKNVMGDFKRIIKSKNE